MPAIPAKPSKPSAYSADGRLEPISITELAAASDADDPARLIPVTISLPASAVAALDAIAASHGHSRSAEIRVIVRALLTTYGLGGALPHIDYSTRAKLQRGAATPPAH